MQDESAGWERIMDKSWITIDKKNVEESVRSLPGGVGCSV